MSEIGRSNRGGKWVRPIERDGEGAGAMSDKPIISALTREALSKLVGAPVKQDLVEYFIILLKRRGVELTVDLSSERVHALRRLAAQKRAGEMLQTRARRMRAANTGK